MGRWWLCCLTLDIQMAQDWQGQGTLIDNAVRDVGRVSLGWGKGRRVAYPGGFSPTSQNAASTFCHRSHYRLFWYSNFKSHSDLRASCPSRPSDSVGLGWGLPLPGDGAAKSIFSSHRIHFCGSPVAAGGSDQSKPSANACSLIAFRLWMGNTKLGCLTSGEWEPRVWNIWIGLMLGIATVLSPSFLNCCRN